ncbi:hypothetical protein PVA45_04855 [Entomospira entomophila]|uniref:Cell division protein ZapB n=1 Tax=Entomospira entomophila TaxID=2719988 RepID=A0A968KTX8_9SPIO|nr:hypothetical protein [Entomospira entomophilus]NIZ40831.1 hypothetical protein [Entomospira entomophilus]WDI35043.1 hypothetical protein PVA45_04855 [Entomospira entomophilus]
MVTLEQVEQLEAKVRQVVSIVEELRVENARLKLEKKQLDADFNVLRERYEIATSKAGALEGAQQMVEKGILEAIDMLDEASKNYNEVAGGDLNNEIEPYIVPQEAEEDISSSDTTH